MDNIFLLVAFNTMCVFLTVCIGQKELIINKGNW